MNNKESSYSGTDPMKIIVAVTLIFIVLKLAKVLTWDWVWVFSPVWIFGSLIVAMNVVLYFILVLAKIFYGILTLRIEKKVRKRECQKQNLE